MMKDRIVYLSRIRALAGMAIVILHTFTMYGMVNADSLSETEEDVTRLVPYLMMWAVPCFVMVSGVLLLDEEREIGIKKILSRYVLRILLVLLLFITLFFFLDLWMGGESFSVERLKEIPQKFFGDGSWAHLWYLYMLIGIYLLLPAFRIIAKHASNATLLYLGIILTIFVSVIPTVEKLTENSIGFVIAISSVFPVYLFLGYMIHKERLQLSMVQGGCLAAVGMLLILVLTIPDLGEKQAVIDKLLGNYAFLPVMLLSVGCFVLLRGRGVPGARAAKIWGFLDRYSFGIYLTHLIYLRFLIRVVKWNPLEYGSFWMLIPVAVGAYAAALLTTMLLKLIPGVRKLL